MLLDVMKTFLLSYLNGKALLSAAASSTNHRQWLNHSFLLHFGSLLLNVFLLILVKYIQMCTCVCEGVCMICVCRAELLLNCTF